MTRTEKADLLRQIAQERILVKDGPYGTAIQNYRLDEAGFRAGRAKQNSDAATTAKTKSDPVIRTMYLCVKRPWFGESCRATYEASSA